MKEMVVLYGGPSLLEELTRGLEATVSRVGVPHTIWHGRYANVVELGDRTPTTLEALEVLEFLAEPIHPRVLVTGESLLSPNFCLGAAKGSGWNVSFFNRGPRENLSRLSREWHVELVPDELPAAVSYIRNHAGAPVKALS